MGALNLIQKDHSATTQHRQINRLTGFFHQLLQERTQQVDDIVPRGPCQRMQFRPQPHTARSARDDDQPLFL